jgi:hypothetical protein
MGMGTFRKCTAELADDGVGARLEWRWRESSSSLFTPCSKETSRLSVTDLGKG